VFGAFVTREGGLERRRAIVLLDNAPMLRLLQHYGWVLAAATEEFCVACLEISVAGGMPGWPPDSAGRRVLVERRGWFESRQAAAPQSRVIRVPVWPARARSRFSGSLMSASFPPRSR
jgi:hypothetical protein